MLEIPLVKFCDQEYGIYIIWWYSWYLFYQLSNKIISETGASARL